MTTTDPRAYARPVGVSGGAAPGLQAMYAAALRGHELTVVDESAQHHVFPVHRWQRPQSSDRALLARCGGATLDVGCGPGRMVAELNRVGQVALGIDVNREAVAQTLARGANALQRDVFDDLPGEGRWQTVLLADGNIGIGGDPERLLRRAYELLMPGGRVVVDVAPPGRRSTAGTYWLSWDGVLSDPFAWAVLGADDIGPVAARAGFLAGSALVVESRWYMVLDRVEL